MAKTASRVERIQDILRSLRTSSSEVVGAAVVSTEGFVIASLLPSDIDEELVAGMGAALLGVGERICTELMQADLSQTYVRSDKGFIVLNAAGPEAVLIVITTKDAKLGLVFLDVKRRVSELMRVL